MAVEDEIASCLKEAKPVRRELQRLAKLLGIKANAKSDVIIAALRDRLEATTGEKEADVEDDDVPPSPDAVAAAPAAAPEERETEKAATTKKKEKKRRSSARQSISTADMVEMQQLKVAAAVEVVQQAVEIDRRGATVARRQAQSAKKAEKRNRERSIAAMSAFVDKGSAKHRLGVGHVARPTKHASSSSLTVAPTTTTTTTTAGAAQPKPLPSLALPPSKPLPSTLAQKIKPLSSLGPPSSLSSLVDQTTKISFAASVNNPLAEATNAWGGAPGSQRKPPKAHKSPNTARDDRRRTIQSAQKKARSELISSARTM